MALRILMTGDDMQILHIDGEMLRGRGFRVYICEHEDILNEMVHEVKPDLVFLNSPHPGKSTTDAYHLLLDNVRHACLPVVFTLLEDDVYLVNRKRTAVKERRYLTSDNILDAIRLALEPVHTGSSRKVDFHNTYRAKRA